MQLTRKRLRAPSVGGLFATRRGGLVVALLCALVAIAVLMFAMGKYRSAVSTSSKQDTVLVAGSEIYKGTSADLIASRRLYVVTPILASQVSPGAVVDAASLSGKIAAGNIYPGQQLTQADFTTGATSVAGELPPTERAVSVTLDAAHGLSDVVQAGDHVDLYGSFAVAGVSVVSLVAPNALVLKTASSSGRQQQQRQSGRHCASRSQHVARPSGDLGRRQRQGVARTSRHRCLQS